MLCANTCISDTEMDGNLLIELQRGRDLLNKILLEQATIDISIDKCRKQIAEVGCSDLGPLKENVAPKSRRLLAETRVDNVELKGIQKSQKISEDLCHGLRSLTGVKALEVTESNRDGGVQLSIVVGECSFEITLDSNKRVSDIIVISGKASLDIEKILQDSRVLPSPQDLRYAIFAVGASQGATEMIRRELPALRKSCIVKVLGPLRFELGLPNSITAVISFHECYPEVPAGVHLDSLSGLEGTTSEIEFLKSAQSVTNSGCCRTVSGMLSLLMGPNALGASRSDT